MTTDRDEDFRSSAAPPFDGKHEPKAGDRLRIEGMRVPAPDVTGATGFTDDWAGALLTICPTFDGYTRPLGTGFMVLPGVALTASHVIEDAVARVNEGATIWALGAVKDQLQPWAVGTITINGDVALLQLVPKFEIPADLELRHFELTSRLPQPGEPVLALGLVSAKAEYPFPADEPLQATGVAAAGVAVERLARIPLTPGFGVHARFFAPSGMSGGPVFDRRGFVFGLLSNSMEGENGEPHDANVLAPLPVLLETIHPPWPPQLFTPASIWPGQVDEAWHIGIGRNDEGQTTFAYFDE